MSDKHKQELLRQLRERYGEDYLLVPREEGRDVVVIDRAKLTYVLSVMTERSQPGAFLSGYDSGCRDTCHEIRELIREADEAAGLRVQA